MANGKIRSKSHITGDRAISMIKDSILPPEWVVRDMNPDYGIDLDVELFDYEDDKCVTLGEHIFIQAKGTEDPKYGKHLFHGSTIDVIKFVMKTSELNLVERMGSALPVLLVLVDLIDNKAFQICLNDYISKVLPVQNPNYRKQGDVTIYIPLKNQLSSTDLNVFRWYGKRTKIYSMFHEMLSDIDDFKYMLPEEIVRNGKRFIEHYRTYDVLKCSSLWYGMKSLQEYIEVMAENDCVLPEAVSFVQRVVGQEDDWKDADVFETFDGEAINSYVYAQKFSLERVFEIITSLSGTFESCCREWCMPGLTLGAND